MASPSLSQLPERPSTINQLCIRRLNMDTSWQLEWDGTNIIVDPWLTGSEIDGFSWFNEQWHTTPPLPMDQLFSLDLENFTAKSFIIDGINRAVGISFFTIFAHRKVVVRSMLFDNTKSKSFYLKLYRMLSDQFWSFKDLKRTISRIIIHTIWDSFTWSIGPNADYRSHIKSDFYFRQYCEFLE